MKNLITTLIFIGFISFVYSQNNLIWTKDYSANLPNYYSNFPNLKLSNDTIKIIGANNYNSIGQHLQIVEYNLSGDTIKTITYGNDSTANDAVIDYKFDANNHLYLLQQKYLGYYKSKIVISKFSYDGNLIWETEIKNSLDTSYQPHSLCFINDTCFFVTAFKESNYPALGDDVISTISRPYVYAYNTGGHKLWEREFDPNTEIKYFMYSTIACNNQGILFGYNYLYNYCMVKIGLNQSVVVVNNIELINGANHILLSSDNNLLITSGVRYRVTKLNLSGDSIWTRDYGTNLPSNVSGDEITSIIQDSLGNIYITGRHYGDQYGTSYYSNADILTIKYNSAGQLIWANRYEYGGNNADIGNVVVLKNGFVYVAGHSERVGVAGDYDYAVLKINSTNGSLVGSYRYNGLDSGDDAATAISVFDNGSVVLTGLSKINSSFNWTTQLLSDITAIESQPKELDNMSIYPNPIIKNGIINIEKCGYRKYNISSINGVVIINGEFSNNFKNTIPIDNLQSGIYFLTLINDKETLTRKIIIE